jgi:uroporphyrinogen-III synthase
MLALQNKKIIITRPKEQSKDFFSKLEQLGAHPIIFPLITIKATNQKQLLSTYKSNKFDWIIFTSYNAVHTFFEVIDSKSVSSKIAVVGSKTELALKNHQLKADFTPSAYTAEILANEIPVTANDSILIPQSAISKSNLADILKNRNTKPQCISTYQNTKVKYNQKEYLALFNQKIDFITFTSGSTVKAFVDLNIDLGKTKVVCIGPETVKVAEANNVKVDGIANPYTIDGMINAMLAFH